MNENNIQRLVSKFLEFPGYLGRGAGYIAKQLNATKKEVYEAKLKAKEILHTGEKAILEKKIEDQEETIKKQEETIKKKFNNKGECDIDGVVKNRIKSLEDLIAACEIDTSVWEILSWECNKWEVGRKNKSVNISYKEGVATGTVDDKGDVFVEPLFQVKAKLRKIQENGIFQKEFTKFLSTYTPTISFNHFKVIDSSIKREQGLLVLPKQDAHFNKFDIKGSNDIYQRFKEVEEATISIVAEANAIHCIDKITYIVGSDQFNSEWTLATTKGTPQQNILSYKESFKAICDHEISIIENLLLYCSNIEILFVPGNHDEYVGWHLINWLKSYYRDNFCIKIEDDREEDRQYESYSNTAIMYNHGAYLKPTDLAGKFPTEYRKGWAYAENFYIFTGDKHHDMSKSINGIKTYQVPALSKAKSKWDDKMGHTCEKAEMYAFFIKENKGLTNMYLRQI